MMYFTTTDNNRIYYELQGLPDSSETIVLLNGLTQSTLSWGLMSPVLGKKYRILLLDFVFQGQSTKNGEWRDFDRHADDVHALLLHLNIPKVILAGLSYGSLVAQHFALRYPEQLSKLILMATFAHKTPYYLAIENAWSKALEMGGYPLLLDIMLPSVLSESYFQNPLIPIDVMKEARKELNNDRTALFKLMYATGNRPDYREKLRKITTPTLVIQGEKDLLFPVHIAQAVHENIPGSRLEVIPGAGHTLNLEAVPQTLELISKFVEAK